MAKSTTTWTRRSATSAADVDRLRGQMGKSSVRIAPREICGSVGRPSKSADEFLGPFTRMLVPQATQEGCQFVERTTLEPRFVSVDP